MVDENSFKVWDVKPKWTVAQSVKYNNGTFTSFDIWGTDRANPTIGRPKTKINSLEEYGQGWIEEVQDIRFSVFVKENGPAFEALRRIAAAGINFKVSCSLVTPGAYQAAWMQGFEEFEGCTVINETVNYAVAEFPVREFEVSCLRHKIKAATVQLPGEESALAHSEIEEGSGILKRSI